MCYIDYNIDYYIDCLYIICIFIKQEFSSNLLTTIKIKIKKKTSIIDLLYDYD